MKANPSTPNFLDDKNTRFSGLRRTRDTVARKLREGRGDNKLVKHYTNIQLGNRCYVFLLRFYLQKLAPKVLEDTDSVFYWKPRDVVPASDSTPWFTLQVIGWNVLASMVKRMFLEVGIDGKTNHSIRATGATCLFEANVPEKLIKSEQDTRAWMP